MTFFSRQGFFPHDLPPKRDPLSGAGFLEGTHLRRSIFFLLALTLLIFFSCDSKKAEEVTPRAEKGVLDLSTWNFEKNGTVSLNGEWEFYWKANMRPGNTAMPYSPREKRYISVPGIWNDFPSDGGPISGKGFATYRLKVTVNPQESTLAFRFIDIATAFTAYVNGREILSVGDPGQSAATTIPCFHPQVVELSPSSPEMDIIIFVSNFDHYKGGIWEEIVLGNPEQVRMLRERKLVFSLFLFGAILLMGLYHLGLFLNHKSDQSSLYYGLFCLVICMRILTTGERYLIQVFPDFPWTVLMRLSYLSFYGAVPLFALYVKSIFSQEVEDKILFPVLLVGAAFSAFVVFAPTPLYTHTVQLYQAFTVLAFLYGFYVIIRARRRKRQGALIFLFGYGMLFLTAVNDILYANLIIVTAYLVPLGLFIFMFSQSFLLSRRFGMAMETIETQKEELLTINAACKNEIQERKRTQDLLRRSNEDLEIRVQERTSALARANQELQEEMEGREKAEQQLRQAQKLEAIGTLAGGIAHDFNNILATIVINSEMALLDLPGRSRVRKNIDLILKSGLSGKDLVRQMLLFSRKSEKKQEILTLTPLIKETFKLLRSSIPTTIQMELHLKTESDAIYADPSQIQQVIMNLCTNAAYAMRGATGSIDISLQALTFDSTDPPEADMPPGDYICLSVKDTGCGMDEEIRKRIFEPFFTTKPAGEGTGLGLSVVYGIVKAHRGHITVYSEPGEGSIFRVYFPRADTGAPVETETPKPIPRGNERILLIDDEEIIVDSIRNMLEHLGYKVTGLVDNREALKLFSEKSSEFDLVITDQTMPFMTGEDLGKELMRLRPDIPIILCTGYSDMISSEKAMAMGFHGFIMKPFTIRESAELVRHVLDRKRSK